MANVYNYKIIVKGAKKNCYAFMYSCNVYNDQYINYEEGTEKKTKLRFTGDCKWSINSYTNSGELNNIDIPDTIEEIMPWCYSTGLCEYDLQSRSKMLDVEIWCTTRVEGGYYPEDYEKYHYKNGEEKSTRRMPAELQFEPVDIDEY